MKFTEIETSPLRLRPFTLDDVDDLHRLWIDPQVRKYLWDDIVITREQALSVVNGSIENFETHGFDMWGVLPKDREVLIGFCGFRFFGDPPEVEILFGIAPAYWGQGLATEAAKAMLRYGFEEHGFDRILAGAEAPNAASFRVMEKTGMFFVKRTCVNGLEVIYYAVSQEAFQPNDSLYRVRCC